MKESYAYEYDKNSNIVKETLYNNYPADAEDKQNEERTYTYDKAGNRLTQKKELASGTETTEYTYNNLNQLLSSKTTNGEGTVTEQKGYLYDANGRQAKETDSISNTVIGSSYDLAGRLASYKKTEKDTVTLTQTNQYNGAGARIRKTEGEEVTNYFYGQGSVLYTEDETGAGTSLNLSGISGNIIATAREEDGAVVGAIAGPKVAKIAKKAAKVVKKKVKSVAKKLKTTKKTAKKATKPKISSTKKVSKTKKVNVIAKSNKNSTTLKTSGKKIGKVSNSNVPKTKKIYRAVDPDEYYDVMKTRKFRNIEMKTLDVKDFGNNFEETLKFADHPINRDKAAILESEIPENLFNQLGHMDLDVGFFKSGTTIVEPEMLNIFNKGIISTRYVF